MYIILLLGSGGREHAIAEAILRSKKCSKLYVAPGNGGTRKSAFNVHLNINDFDQVEAFCNTYHVDMLVVGPEQPLVGGIYDHFRNKDVMVIGPSQAAAALEGSKSFAKEFMAEFDIPTASYQAFDKSNIDAGIAYIKDHAMPIVLKADGLAAGKGVLIIDEVDEAVEQFKNMLNGKFGKASDTVVVEQFLSGIEFSVFVATDGSDYCILPEAKDYKRIGEGDTGLNTGGMGAVSPVPFADKAIMDQVEEQIVKPTIAGLQKRNLEYKGFIFLGLIKVENEVYVIEYNVRMGDPETQVVFPRIKSDVVELFEAMAKGNMKSIDISVNPQTAVTVYTVSGGYPEAYEKGKTITVPFENEDYRYYHGGTLQRDNYLLTNGGRVLACTAFADSLEDAIKKAQLGASSIRFEGKYYRTDIGQDLT